MTTPLDPRSAPFDAIGDGVTDDTIALQACIDAAIAGKQPVHAGTARYRITNRINLNGHVAFIGDPWQDKRAEADILGTQIYIDFGTGTAAEAFHVTARSVHIENVEFYTDQPTPGPGWVPATKPWAIHAFRDPAVPAINGNQVYLRNIMLRNVSHGIWLNGLQRAELDGIYGQPLIRGVLYEEIVDATRLINLHFWPYWWASSEDVIAWTRVNAAAIESRRNDNPKWVNLFSYGYRNLLRFNQGTTGITSRFELVNAGADNAHRGIEVVTGTNGHSGMISNFYGHGSSSNPAAGDIGILFSASCGFARIQATNIRLSKVANGINILNNGNPNRLMIDNLTVDEYDRGANGSAAVSVGTGSVLRMGPVRDFVKATGGTGPEFGGNGTKYLAPQQ